ncbi:CHASE3 domain-containing protein [Brucella pseudogrignonensis]|uniref:sensor histidine kinase n=1 Tax=Brucella pseudogrignonensis TaxID=419475 RepID=UPI0028B2E756|nr:CHASE3 domain-containing protein [Brucella pseudogrignonensis]MDT6939327.1 CHASE3 domain-containing protein [Brucella pseudogrignonensis]
MPSPFSSGLLKPSIRPIAVIVSLSLVLLSALITLFLSAGVNNQIVDISKNFELREQVGKVMRIAYNIEMSRRGYLLTLDDAYLDLYQRSIVNIDQTLADLGVLTKDNPQQDGRIRIIKALVEHAHDDVRQTIDLAKAGNVQEAIKKVRSDEGKVLMDQLTETVSQFITIEEKELAERNKHIDTMRYWMTVASVVALISGAILAFLLFSRVQRVVRALFEGQSVLLSQNELLEERVRERTAELERERSIAERERKRVEILLQDSNHRIGNSLATVSSLLGLQLRQTRSTEARAALSAARDRVQTVSTAHRRLRLGEDMESTRVDEFLETVIEDIRHAIGEDRKISFQTDLAPLDLKARDVTTIGIILGELITNAIKHAFKGQQEGTISVSFKHDDETGVLVLIVEDNGIGLQHDEALSTKDQAGLGTLVVEQLCMQFGEKPVYSSCEGGTGTRVIVRLSGLKEHEKETNSETSQ